LEKEERERLAEEECRKAFEAAMEKEDLIRESYTLNDGIGIDGHCKEEYAKVKAEFFRHQREIKMKYGLLNENER